jgi:hypothetical protein
VPPACHCNLKRPQTSESALEIALGGGAQIDRVKDAPESGPGGTTVGVKCDCDVSQWACRLRLDPEFAKRGHAKASLKRADQRSAACAAVLTQWQSPLAYAGRLCTGWRLHPSVQHGLDSDKPAAAGVKGAPRGTGRLHGQRMFCSYDARDCKQSSRLASSVCQNTQPPRPSKRRQPGCCVLHVVRTRGMLQSYAIASCVRASRAGCMLHATCRCGEYVASTRRVRGVL